MRQEEGEWERGNSWREAYEAAGAISRDPNCRRGVDQQAAIANYIYDAINASLRDKTEQEKASGLKEPHLAAVRVLQMERLLDSIDLALRAHCGPEPINTFCRCDADVGEVPCEYCAIYEALTKSRYTISVLLGSSSDGSGVSSLNSSTEQTLGEPEQHDRLAAEKEPSERNTHVLQKALRRLFNHIENHRYQEPRHWKDHGCAQCVGEDTGRVFICAFHFAEKVLSEHAPKSSLGSELPEADITFRETRYQRSSTSDGSGLPKAEEERRSHLPCQPFD